MEGVLFGMEEVIWNESNHLGIKGVSLGMEGVQLEMEGLLFGTEGVIWNESNHLGIEGVLLGMELGMEGVHLGKKGIQL
jgi:hypothetical protein